MTPSNPRPALTPEALVEMKERAANPIYVVFDGPPSHESGRFVEVEDAQGRGQSAGEWKQRGAPDDAYWTLGPFHRGVDLPAALALIADLLDVIESRDPARLKALTTPAWRSVATSLRKGST